jgi:alkanesulfonate monooxygenase SsuD/methylene tetrahydromethanopterin reductase-like flavin-dependent oxidoreductase (luciferase family)
MRDYVASLAAAGGPAGGLPPIVLAALRRKMTDLAVEVADGAVWANAACSYMPTSLDAVPPDRREEFLVANMVPTVIDDDIEAAAAVCRRTLTGYVALPNYRNYWKAAGYDEEMTAIHKALAEGDGASVEGAMSDEWLSDVTLYGSVGRVRDGVERWFASGAHPILVPSSTSGGQMKALEELFAAFA